jgi:enediyne biosynthesis protein E4
MRPENTSLREKGRLRMTRLMVSCLAVWFASVGAVLAQSETPAAKQRFVFRDVAQEAGLLPAAKGIMGHGAGWGDVNGDGWPDLYIGTFHYENTQPNLLFLNKNGKFTLAEEPELRISTRATGVVFADFDNDGDLDLYVGSMPAAEDSRLAQRTGHAFAGCSLFRNEGNGKFTNLSEGNGACPKAFGGRSAAVLDYDGDGLLDLLVGEDPIPGYNGSPTKSSRLFKNKGNLQFEDVSRQAGLPEDAAGLGVAAADINQDGWPDLFLASTLGNYLLLNDGKGRFQEAAGARKVFAWPDAKGDDMVCGVAIADVNGDGLPDIVLGQHFSRPWTAGVANRLYLNRGITDGVPRFEDVTEAVGLVPLPMKGPHVEIQDFDNDGRPDIYTSIVKFAGGEPHPVIFRNLGNENGLPRFEEYALGVNDFPTEEDRAIKRSGTLFEKVIAERKIIYTAAGPSCDFDRDGRLDMFLANWWAESPSMLLKNETPAGNWLDVQVEGRNGVNRMGIGSRVEIYAESKAGDANSRLGVREIAAGFGYASGQEAIAHFGLGDRDRVDVVVILPHGKGTITQKNVEANQRITIKE